MHQNWDIVFGTAEQNSSKSRKRISELWYKVRFFNPDQTLMRLKFKSVSSSLNKIELKYPLNSFLTFFFLPKIPFFFPSIWTFLKYNNFSENRSFSQLPLIFSKRNNDPVISVICFFKISNYLFLIIIKAFSVETHGMLDINEKLNMEWLSWKSSTPLHSLLMLIFMFLKALREKCQHEK